MLRKVLLVALTAVMAFPATSEAGFLKLGLNEEEVQGIVKKYIEDHPEAIVEAFDRFQQKKEAERQAALLKKVQEVRPDLEQNEALPVIGNPKGDVVVIEFFDYNCGYCKMMFTKVLKGVEKDGNIRWVLVDLPTLSETSEKAALAGLAANKQGKYFEMHSALMTHKGGLTDEVILSLAEKVGLDMEQYKKDVEAEELKDLLKKNRQIADSLEFRGIPQFVIGDYISRGAMMGNELEENVKIVREKAKNAPEAK